MFKKLRLSVKLIASFVVVALIAVMAGLSGWLGVNRLSGHIKDIGLVHMPAVQSLLEISRQMESLRVGVRSLLNPNLKPEDRTAQVAAIEAARQQYKAAWSRHEALPRNAEETKLWDQFKSAVAEWERANDEFLGLAKELESTEVNNPTDLLQNIERIRADHYQLMSSAQFLVFGKVEFEGGEDPGACHFTQWVAGQHFTNKKIKEALHYANSQHQTFHNSVPRLKSFVAKDWGSQAEEVLTAEMQPAAEGMFKEFQALRDEAHKAQGIYEKMNQQVEGACVEKQLIALGLLERMIAANTKLAAKAEQAAATDAEAFNTLAVGGTVLGFMTALGLGLALSFSISRALRRIIAGLSEGADQVATAAGEISAASQTLASGAAQQAAGVEETSASVEEMSSMTRRNAENAGQADRLMQEATGLVDQANSAMESLTASITDISKASEETGKIIKTIDEIAFQTNLLALNAAVEAARAGAAGAGFAVVADEVRNLAKRAADAAKSTADLIEGTVKSVKAGAHTVGETVGSFDAITAQTAKVSGLIAEIAAASTEQAQGIAQVNASVTDIDKITQQNAANAEESAAAAEQMSAQSEQMKSMVGELAAMVEGGGAHGQDDPREPEEPSAAEEAAPMRRLRERLWSKIAGLKDRETGSATPAPTPDRIIPTDDSGFKDF